MKLHLHVKTEYFNAVKSGEKTFEFRLLNKYWSDRLINKSYDRIVYYNAYKPGTENRMEFPWRGFHLVEIAHKHFGDQKVKCFAIGLSGSEANPERLPGGTTNVDTNQPLLSAAPVDRVVGQCLNNEEVNP